MEFYSSLSKEQCIEIIGAAINKKNRNYSLILPDILFKNELIGDINNNRFWIERVKMRYWLSASRAFEGEIVQDEKGTLIRGKFRFPMLYKNTIVCILLIVFICFSIAPFSKFPLFGTYLLTSLFNTLLFIVGLFIFISFSFILLHHNDEQYVKNYLTEKLCAYDYPM